ncbi:MAG: hypothetical protein RIQ89_667 [Bacteroidota bacterium]|jgi:hypothetical protein
MIRICAIKMVVFFVLCTALALPVQWLWNNILIRAVDWANTITYLHAVGLILLFRILFLNHNHLKPSTDYWQYKKWNKFKSKICDQKEFDTHFQDLKKQYCKKNITDQLPNQRN